MFKKPATLKPASPLRSSARRALVAHLRALYPALDGASPEIIQLVVPVGLKQCGATTSGGHRAVIYTDDAGKPFWFEVGHDAGTALQQSQEKKKGKGPNANSVANGKNSNGITVPVPKLAEVLPTVYTLWILPTLLPRLPTWPQIVDPVLLSGSALMVPGLIPAPHTYPDALQCFEQMHDYTHSEVDEDGEEGETVNGARQPGEAEGTSIPAPEKTILSHGKPRKSALVAITPYPSQVPLVLARLDADIDEVVSKRAAGEKGKAATTLHALGDHLWELGGKGAPPKDGEGTLSDKTSLAQPQLAEVADLSLNDQPQNRAVGVSREQASELEKDDPTDSPGASFSAAEVDAILRLALLQALAGLLKQPSSFPLPASALYSTHVLPNRPAQWPPRDIKGKRPARLPASFVGAILDEQEGEKVVSADATDVRHSSSKKLAKWLKAAEKDDLLKTKEAKGKDTVITSINGAHRDLKALVPFKTIQHSDPEVHDTTRTSQQNAATDHPSNASLQKPKRTAVVIERFWRATSSGVQLFQEMGCSTSEPLSRPVIKAYILDFIAKKALADPRNQSLVRIADPLLTHALYPKAPLNEIPPVLRREEIVDRVLSISCQEFHRTSRLLPETASRVLLANTKGTASSSQDANDKPRDEPIEADADAGEVVGQMSKGAAQSIKVEIRTRQGRKVVSLITSLDVYDIDAEAFAGDLMRIAGAAASTSPLPGSTAKHPRYEIFIQGDQRKIIFDMLETQHGVDRRFVQIHDLTKK